MFGCKVGNYLGVICEKWKILFKKSFLGSAGKNLFGCECCKTCLVVSAGKTCLAVSAGNST